ncbi:MAG: MEDS domain-containing protein [Candidatus Bathyarchaeota archaeon]|jgi:hypothetical protein
MTIPIYRPYVFLRCRKCGRKTEHVLVDITIASRKRGIEETYECQECGDVKRVYELSSELESALNMREGEVSIVTYTSTVDKMKIFSDFIREGLENGDLVDYTYPDSESETVRAKLERYGIDVKKKEKNGTLLMRSLTEEYLPDGRFDKDGAIEKILNRRAKAKEKGYKHFRELEDVGDFSFLNGKWQNYIDLWDDPKWEVPSGSDTEVLSYSPFIIELIAFDVEKFGEAQIAEMLKAFWERKPSSTLFIDTRAYTVATTHLQEFMEQFASTQILKQMNGSQKVLLQKHIHH